MNLADYLKHYWVKDEGYKTPCWIWKGTVDTKGYGQIYSPGFGNSRRTSQAHRVFYEAHRETIPAGHILDHLCKIKRCVNPEHLEIVTNKINIRRGNVCKITKEIADEIRKEHKEGKRTILALQAIYKLSRSSIYYILRDATWTE